MKINYYQLMSCLYKIDEYKNDRKLDGGSIPDCLDDFTDIVLKEAERISRLSLPDFLRRNLKLALIPDLLFQEVVKEIKIDVNDKKTIRFYRKGVIRDTEQKMKKEFQSLIENTSHKNGYLVYEPAIVDTEKISYGNKYCTVRTDLKDKALRLKQLKRNGYSVNKEMNVVFDQNGVLLGFVARKIESIENLFPKIQGVEIERLLKDGYKLKLGSRNETKEMPVYCTNFLELYNKENGTNIREIHDDLIPMLEDIQKGISAEESVSCERLSRMYDMKENLVNTPPCEKPKSLYIKKNL